MSPSDGLEEPIPSPSGGDGAAQPGGTVEYMLFESLLHHLIEKGVLTKNDALSVVQTVAEVTRGQLHEGRGHSSTTQNALAMLKRMYSSLEAMSERIIGARVEGGNVLRMRPPLHDDRPEFPRDD